MTLRRPGSFIHALTRSLLVGLTILWLAGVLGSGLILKRLIARLADALEAERSFTYNIAHELRTPIAAALAQAQLLAANATGGTTICVRCRDTPDGAVLAVIDDGPGSPDGKLEALVKRFARGTRAAGSGAGLGLSIVDTLARRMGAQLVLRCSPAAQGTGFEARLMWPASATRGAPAGKVA